MTKEWQWSLKTYQLNTIKDIFGLPCVIRLTEGYMTDDESEEFAQGDILTIDTELVSDKVAAMFTRCASQKVEKPRKRVPNYGIITLNQPEVFLPYGYDGKLKVLKPITDVTGVKDLATVFPRYATLRENLAVETNVGESVKISKGTKIEIDRIIPGSTYGKGNGPDKLVIQFEHSGKTKLAALCFTTKGKYRTEEDHTEYTISEAIDRYGLPLDVKFSSNEIRHIFEQDMTDGRRPRTQVTGTLRLNRIVKQHVLVGHYKPVYENANPEARVSSDTGDVRRRTVIVLPVDVPDIGNIEVNIYDGDVLTIYEKLVNIQSVTEARDMVRDTLCIDFSVKPGIKLIAETKHIYANVSHGQITQDDTRDTRNELPPSPMRPAHPHEIKRAFDKDWRKKKDTPHFPEPPTRCKKLPTQRKPASENDLDDGYEGPVKTSGEDWRKKKDTPPPPKPPTRCKQLPTQRRPAPEIDLDDVTSPYLEMNWKNRTGNSVDKQLVLPRRPNQIPSTRSGSGKTEREMKHPEGKLWPNTNGSFKSHINCATERTVPMARSPEVYVEDNNLNDYEIMVAFTNASDGVQNNQTSKPLVVVGNTGRNAEVFAEYMNSGGPQLTSEAVVKPVGTNSALPFDNDYEIYKEKDGIEELKKSLEMREQEQMELLRGAQSQRVMSDVTEWSTIAPRRRVTDATESADRREQVVATTAGQSNTPGAENKQMLYVRRHPGFTDNVNVTAQRPTANVSPLQNSESRQKVKLFQDLSNTELIERLKLCSMVDMAEICKSENLDGAFFEDSTVEFLRETMGLQGLKLAKFLKIKNENWVPR